MGEGLSALVRALRTFLQGLAAAVLVAGGEALHTALTSGSFDLRFAVMAVITAAVGAAVSYAYNVIAPRVGVSGSPSWEGLLRAGRTLVQTVVAVGLMAGWDSIYATVTGGNYSPADIAKGAVAAVVTAVVAYLQVTFETSKAKAAKA
jgi:hypothetical protein